MTAGGVVGSAAFLNGQGGSGRSGENSADRFVGDGADVGAGGRRAGPCRGAAAGGRGSAAGTGGAAVGGRMGGPGRLDGLGRAGRGYVR
jgi:hypothetical protein